MLFFIPASRAMHRSDNQGDQPLHRLPGLMKDYVLVTSFWQENTASCRR
jgi:hypothetical protein